VRVASRLVFLFLLGGGLLLWAQLRRPRQMLIELDLATALAGEISEVDIVVRREGHALARHQVRYGPSGAPGIVPLALRAPRGEAEVEATLIYSGRPARRIVAQVLLEEGAAARVEVKP
jgi:hypothetical protein